MLMAPATTLPRRASGSPTAAETDALFEFDAPQLYVDLRAASTSTDADARDPWFDALHEQHSRPSAELARELARELKQPQQKDSGSAQEQDAAPRRQLSPGSEKENRGERKPSDRTGRTPARSKFLSLREARAKHEPFQVATAKVPVKSVAAPPTRRKRANPAGDADSSDSSRSSDAHSPKRRRPLGSLGNAKARKTATLTSRSGSKPASRAGGRPQPPQQQHKQQPKPKPKRSRPVSASAAADADMRDLKEMLARHNKKFKAQHTYEPPQHSVRDVKMWERETKQSFYALSVEERHRANEEIAQWLKERRETKLDRVGAQ